MQETCDGLWGASLIKIRIRDLGAGGGLVQTIECGRGLFPFGVEGEWDWD